MKCVFIHLLTLLLLSACALNLNRSPTPIATVSSDDLSILTLEELSEEYKNLRMLKGQFEGGKWDDEIDSWMGRKHQLMLELESRLSKEVHTQEQIIRLLGTPDLTVSQGDHLFDELIGSSPLAGKEVGEFVILIYFWRGVHDFVYFVCDERQVIYSGWWYTGE